MKWESERILPLVPTMRAEASRSKSAPVVVRTSQPSPTRTARNPGASLLSETLPPLLKLTLMTFSCPMGSDRSMPIFRCRSSNSSEATCPVPGWFPAGSSPDEPSDAHAEVARDSGEPGAVALADRAELPLVVVAVQLAEDHRRLGGGVLRQVVARDLDVVGLVGDPDEGVAHLAEALSRVVGLVDRHREDDPKRLGRHCGEVDADLLVVAAALAGEVVTGVLDRALGRGQVVEEDEVLVAEDLALGVADDGAGVQIERLAVRRAGVPTEPDHDSGEPGRRLGERDVAAL